MHHHRSFPSFRSASSLLTLLAGCATGSTSGDVAPPPESPSAFRDVVLSYRDGTVDRQRPGANLPQSLVAADELLYALPSPHGTNVAVSLRSGDSTMVVVIGLATGRVSRVHAGVETVYTAAWSLDGRLLGVGHRGPRGGGIVVVDTAGRTRDMGCRAANRFEAWRSATEAIVHDGVNFYTVNASTCSTLATFPMAGKSDMTYAQNGQRVAFLRARTVRFANRDEPESIPELWIASHDGSNAEVVADFQSRPRGAVWAPDGRRIAYEARSRQYADTYHVVEYDLGSKQYSVNTEPRELGVPHELHACWAPDSRHVAHDRTFGRSTGDLTYTTRQTVVREAGSAVERIVFEEIVREDRATILRDFPARCAWAGPNHLIIHSRQASHVVNLADGSVQSSDTGVRVLGVQSAATRR